MTRYFDGEPTFKCWLCQDTGFVPIVHPRDLRTIIETWGADVPDNFDYPPLNQETVRRLENARCSIACHCPAGKPKLDPHYDETRDCRFDGRDYQAVRNWIAEKRSFQEVDLDAYEYPGAR